MSEVIQFGKVVLPFEDGELVLRLGRRGGVLYVRSAWLYKPDADAAQYVQEMQLRVEQLNFPALSDPLTPGLGVMPERP